MAYFPFFINIKNQKCYIFGGGMIAYRKIEALLEFEADITVISPLVCEQIKKLEGKINIITRTYREEDIETACFVIAATDDVSINSMISDACRKRNILVNVVDELEKCSFLFPAYVKKGDISVGITTSGKSPVIAGYIKKSIFVAIPDYYETLVDTLGRYREMIKGKINSASERAAIFKELADIGIENEGKVMQEDIDAVIKRQEDHYSQHEKNS